jgi:hypothetical protein
MPVYGDIDTVTKMLRPDEYSTYQDDITDRLTSIQAAISLDLEYKLGRTFGVVAADTSELHWVGPYDTLVLNKPARSVTSITYGGTLSGSTMTGGTTTLAADLYNVITDPYTGYIYAIANAAGGMWDWYAPSYLTGGARTPVVVTADYVETDNDTDVPADITYAANILILKMFQIEMASPAGFYGIDGATVPITDPWKHPSVKAVLDKYGVKCGWPV